VVVVVGLVVVVLAETSVEASLIRCGGEGQHRILDIDPGCVEGGTVTAAECLGEHLGSVAERVEPLEKHHDALTTLPRRVEPNEVRVQVLGHLAPLLVEGGDVGIRSGKLEGRKGGIRIETDLGGSLEPRVGRSNRL
jgi:hypothetical protein